MRSKGKQKLARLPALFMAAVLLFAQGAFAEEWADYSDDYSDSYSEEYYEENDDSSQEDDIPDTYYDTILSNQTPGWPQGPAILSASAVVADLDTGAILYSKNPEDKHYPASITKVMTTLVALDEKGGHLDDIITCTHAVFEIESGSSNLWMEPEEKINYRDALYGFMLESANDLGMAIAIDVAGSVEAFADLMNKKAESLGCVNTHFTNPHGLHDENHYTCAADMAKIAAAAYENPIFRQICGTEYYTIPKTNKEEEPRYLHNHHKIIREDEEYFRSWCTGGKTGYTSDAWNTLVTYGEKDGKRLVCVVMRTPGLDCSYTETTALMEYAFDNFSHVNMTQETSSPSFYQIMGLDYPDPDHILARAPELEESVITVVSPGVVTIPAGADEKDVTQETAGGKIVYKYGGWPVGSGQINIRPIPEKVTYSYRTERDMTAALQTAEKAQEKAEKDQKRENAGKEVEEVARKAWQQVTGVARSVASGASEYVNNNTLTVLLVGIFVLIVIIILIVILVMRSTRESRIRRRRQISRRRREKEEAEIERKSALEIEKELREAMELAKMEEELPPDDPGAEETETSGNKHADNGRKGRK